MSSWTTPKTDWDETDYYNYGDLNRVENNTEYVKDLMNSAGYDPVMSAYTQNRTNESIEYYDSLNRVEGNILALKQCSYEPLTWQTPKTDWESVVDNFDFEDANRLESNLLGLKEMTDNIILGFLKCGDAQTSICGKGNTLF